MCMCFSTGEEEMFVGNIRDLAEMLDDKAELHRLHAVKFYALERNCKRYSDD